MFSFNNSAFIRSSLAISILLFVSAEFASAQRLLSFRPFASRMQDRTTAQPISARTVRDTFDTQPAPSVKPLYDVSKANVIGATRSAQASAARGCGYA